MLQKIQQFLSLFLSLFTPQTILVKKKKKERNLFHFFKKIKFTFKTFFFFFVNLYIFLF
ncbi:hypothetical protein BCR36DRAFT_159255 [Piromyces finnis]|uniref:Uncharacterized protein n=1 Tax=Piromyces finnis TaxID=1754191 RepID=A0A1Y1UXB9_9FUNG|nr:hypothetical protein BCR36DRAFT_159255 [Piromyces finnis]|eukprot:ORX42332.1 hypothetical protein BCR36DRAFT_159255 [Piromyces finnis]